MSRTYTARDAAVLTCLAGGPATAPAVIAALGTLTYLKVAESLERLWLGGKVTRDRAGVYALAETKENPCESK